MTDRRFNSVMWLLGFVVAVLAITSSAVHYNTNETERMIACADQKLGYFEGGCVEP